MRTHLSPLTTALLYMAALAFGLVGAVVVPAYAFFMVVWMHAPVGKVLVSTATVAAVMLFFARGAVGLARRRR